MVRRNRLRQRVALVATGRTELVQAAKLFLRRGEIVQAQIKLAQIFVREKVIGIFLQRGTIIIERQIVVARHVMGIAEKDEDVRIVRPFLMRAVQIGNCLRIFPEMNKPASGRVVVHLRLVARVRGRMKDCRVVHPTHTHLGECGAGCRGDGEKDNDEFVAHVTLPRSSAII